MFEVARLKIKRASKHIDELNGEVSAFLNTGFCTISVEKVAGTPRHLVKAKVVKPFPSDWPLIIGDAVHNLRAALDLLMSAMIENAGETPAKTTYFPFSTTRDSLVGGIAGGQVKILGQDIIDVIVDTIRPYEKEGDADLYALGRLDITDKHKLLIPLVRPVRLSGVTARFGPVRMTDCSFGLSESGEMNIAGVPSGDIEIQSYGKASFDVLFGKEQPLEGEPVIPSLIRLSQRVEGAVKAIEAAYLARG